MKALPKTQFLSRTTVAKASCLPLRLTALAVSLLLAVMPFLTGCGGGENEGTGITASLAWQPVEDPSVMGYFVYYGRQSAGQPGGCHYEGSTYVESPSATVENLDPNTLYYFSVSAYNGLESPCSEEVSTVTPPPSDSANQPLPLT